MRMQELKRETERGGGPERGPSIRTKRPTAHTRRRPRARSTGRRLVVVCHSPSCPSVVRSRRSLAHKRFPFPSSSSSFTHSPAACTHTTSHSPLTHPVVSSPSPTSPHSSPPARTFTHSPPLAQSTAQPAGWTPVRFLPTSHPSPTAPALTTQQTGARYVS